MTKQQQYGEMMRAHGPIPSKRGAGNLYEDVEFGPDLTCDTHTTRSSVRVAHSYKYPVYDHHITWSLPRSMCLVLIEGVVTALNGRAYRRGDHRRRAVPCAWPKRTRGYSGRWVTGYLCGSMHLIAPSATEAWARYQAHRAAEREQRLATSIEADLVRRGWVTERAARLLIGACQPGLLAAREAIESAVGADGRIGAVRIETLEATHPTWATRLRQAAGA